MDLGCEWLNCDQLECKATSLPEEIEIPNVDIGPRECRSVKTIELTQGYETLIDDADFDRFSMYKWCANIDRRRGKVYAYRKTQGPHEKRKSVYLHREILGVTDSKVRVDHDDGDGLNNQRYNIRTCSTRQNNMNQKKRRDGFSSRYKGVCWHKRDQKFYAAIKINGRSKFLGRFDSERDAAMAYDAAARKHFGDFAVCNFPPDLSEFVPWTRTSHEP